jgi:hypothetical protein
MVSVIGVSVGVAVLVGCGIGLAVAVGLASRRLVGVAGGGKMVAVMVGMTTGATAVRSPPPDKTSARK